MCVFFFIIKSIVSRLNDLVAFLVCDCPEIFLEHTILLSTLKEHDDHTVGINER